MAYNQPRKKHFAKAPSTVATVGLSALLLIVFYCQKKKEIYTDMYPKLPTAAIEKITIEFNINPKEAIYITKKEGIQAFITNVNNVRLKTYMKAPKWDVITLQYKDRDIRLYTNGEVFGMGKWGKYYSLNDNYKHYWKKM